VRRTFWSTRRRPIGPHRVDQAWFSGASDVLVNAASTNRSAPCRPGVAPGASDVLVNAASTDRSARCRPSVALRCVGRAGQRGIDRSVRTVSTKRSSPVRRTFWSTRRRPIGPHGVDQAWLSGASDVLVNAASTNRSAPCRPTVAHDRWILNRHHTLSHQV
jgi:hypothetical protein